MRIILPNYEIWEQEPGEDGIYRQVERAGRVCYKSEDRATKDSARPFAQRMINNQHTAMLEHALDETCRELAAQAAEKSLAWKSTARPLEV